MNKCKKNVMWKDSVAGFVKNGLKNCQQLHDELISGKYKIRPYSIFIIHEKKTRVISSTKMRDRVFQRSLCDNYLYDELTKGFIYDNCACLKERGTDFARNRLKCHMQRYFRKHGCNGYALKIDLHDFFGSTPHETAKKAVDKRVKDEWAKQMVYDIIDSFTHISPDRGIGLGSQISQLVQLAVLDDIDHKIKEQLKIKYYVRYMDDFVLIHESKKYLEQCLENIKFDIEQLGLEINEKKTGIKPLKHGIKFLGFKFHLTDTGKVIMKLQAGKLGKETRKLKKLSAIVDRDKLVECYKSWRNYASKGNNYCLVQRADSFVRELENKTYEHSYSNGVA